MTPHVDAVTNMAAAMRMEARRPHRSASQPQTKGPITVPVIPDRAYSATGHPAAWG